LKNLARKAQKRNIMRVKKQIKRKMQNLVRKLKQSQQVRKMLLPMTLFQIVNQSMMLSLKMRMIKMMKTKPTGMKSPKVNLSNQRRSMKLLKKHNLQ